MHKAALACFSNATCRPTGQELGSASCGMVMLVLLVFAALDSHGMLHVFATSKCSMEISTPNILCSSCCTSWVNPRYSQQQLRSVSLVVRWLHNVSKSKLKSKQASFGISAFVCSSTCDLHCWLVAALRSMSAVEVRALPGRGRGLVTTRQVEGGEAVLVEEPLLLTVSQEAKDNACAHCLCWLEHCTGKIRCFNAIQSTRRNQRTD